MLKGGTKIGLRDDNAANQDHKLVQLLINGKAYADLHAKRLVAENELRKIDAEIHAKKEGVQSLLEWYRGGLNTICRPKLLANV